MARKGLDSRLDRIMDLLVPPNTMAHREYHLAPEHRAALTSHRRTTAAKIDGLENSAPGSWYGAFLDNDPNAQLPPMPYALRKALNLPEPPVVTPDTSADEAARLWQRFALGDEQ
ncbi:MAG: hypothetical protein DI591_00115 [Citromicrobium sp.]|nr:MAG: hypothetical protein DI591_00115 [Citromicrobium sp.]